MTIKDLTNTFDGAYQMHGNNCSTLCIDPECCNITIIDENEIIFTVELNEVHHACSSYDYYEGLFLDGDDVKFARTDWRDLCNLEIDSFNIDLNAGKFNFYIDYYKFSSFMSSDKFFLFDKELIELYNR